jgi:hypothetical protein
MSPGENPLKNAHQNRKLQALKNRFLAKSIHVVLAKKLIAKALPRFLAGDSCRGALLMLFSSTERCQIAVDRT